MIKPEDNLRYAACLLACAVAGADGRVQQEEMSQLRTIINQELILNKNFKYAGMLDRLLANNHALKADHNWAMSEIKKNEKQVTPLLKQQFISLMEKVAGAFPPVTPEENAFVQKIRTELEAIGAAPSQE
jgi:uncharacterized tellurite resistance protein B-like protein